MITYSLESFVSVAEFKSLLIASTLGERRPVTEDDRLAQMLKHANLIVSARDKGKLIGISRSLTDFGWCTYLSDLAVDAAYQRQGIGKELIRRTQAAAPQAKIILLAAPAAVDYYPKIGMTYRDHCYLLSDGDALK